MGRAREELPFFDNLIRHACFSDQSFEGVFLVQQCDFSQFNQPISLCCGIADRSNLDRQFNIVTTCDNRLTTTTYTCASSSASACDSTP